MRIIGLALSIVLAVAHGAINICTLCNHDFTAITTVSASTNCHDNDKNESHHSEHECKTTTIEAATLPGNDTLNVLSIAASLIVKVDFDLYSATSKLCISQSKVPLSVQHPQRPSLEVLRC